MDKEAQDTIALLIYQELRVYPDGGKSGRIAKEVLSTIDKLGYHKLPKDKPPLLSDGEIREAFEQWIPDGTRNTWFYGWLADFGAELEKVAQLQRELDIEFYTKQRG